MPRSDGSLYIPKGAVKIAEKASDAIAFAWMITGLYALLTAL